MANVTKTYLPNIENYKKYIDNIFKNNWITNNGQYVRELTERLKNYLGVKNLILVANGTLALEIAYKLLSLKGDVITTPFSFVATTSSLVWGGLNPIFTDIDGQTLNMNFKNIESKITKNTSCILPVHVFGNACEVEKIEDIARAYNLKLIFDGAHVFGVKYKEKSILEHGDISILSFHATKIFHTIEGGALIIKDDDVYKRAIKMINFGIGSGDSIDTLGINAKMNEFQAAMGICVLKDMNLIFNNRKEVYARYIQGLGSIPNIQLQKHNPNCTMNYGYFPIIFENEEVLIKIKETLNREGINPRRYFYPSLENLPYITDKKATPISNNISKRILCLPMYDSLEKEVQKIIVQVIMDNV